jgi:hypothetical protein
VRISCIEAGRRGRGGGQRGGGEQTRFRWISTWIKSMYGSGEPSSRRI